VLSAASLAAAAWNARQRAIEREKEADYRRRTRSKQLRKSLKYHSKNREKCIAKMREADLRRLKANTPPELWEMRLTLYEFRSKQKRDQERAN
jgi:hypothetical protein